MLSEKFGKDPKKALERAFELSERGWFPANPDVVKKISEGLENGTYEADRDSLLTDLKSDLSLWLYCLKEVQKILQQEEEQQERPTFKEKIPEDAPFAILTPQRVLKILNQPDSPLLFHSISKVSEYQALRLQEAVISVSTAEVLAEEYEVNPDLGYTAAVFRQLGMMLIAWNFPRVYQTALDDMVEAHLSLDELLKQRLGFSPLLLALRFAERCILPEEVVQAISSSSNKTVKPNDADVETGDFEFGKPKKKNTLGILATICNAGEALARAQDPIHYPNAEADWDSAFSVVRDVLGAQGVQQIFEHASRVSEHYVSQVPQLNSFAEESKIDPESSQYGISRRRNNVYLKGLDPDVRKCFEALYVKINEATVSDELLRELFHTVIPELGFSASAVFTLDPSRTELHPVLRKGVPSAVKLQPVALDADFNRNPISDVFDSGRIREDVTDLDGGLQAQSICGVIEGDPAIGVLYLETKSNQIIRCKGGQATAFKAVVRCLADVLHL